MTWAKATTTKLKTTLKTTDVRRVIVMAFPLAFSLLWLAGAPAAVGQLRERGRGTNCQAAEIRPFRPQLDCATRQPPRFRSRRYRLPSSRQARACARDPHRKACRSK